jgi:hypothetical protein
MTDDPLALADALEEQARIASFQGFPERADLFRRAAKALREMARKP